MSLSESKTEEGAKCDIRDAYNRSVSNDTTVLLLDPEDHI